MQIWRKIKRLLLNKIFSGLLIGVIVVSAIVYISHETNLDRVMSVFKIAPHFDMSDKLRDGIALLKTTPPLQYENGKSQIELAILNVKTGDLFASRIWTTRDGTVISGELPVRILWWNSFNSVYEVKGRPEYVVVANKFLVDNRYLPEQKNLKLVVDAPHGLYTDMVYVPYSEQIHKQDVIEAGKKYIDTHVEEAYKELEEANVQSHSRPGKLVIDAVQKDFVKTIVIIEHVDPGWLQLSDDGGRRLAERTLVIIGANQEWAYRYTNSSANAYGLAQFIESTYDLMVERYPEAGLIKDHTLGMADHANAFKAMVLLFDNEAREILEKTEQPVTRQMLAAAYNGGTARVINAVLKNGQLWADSDIFPEETNEYVKKYDLIAKLGIF